MSTSPVADPRDRTALPESDWRDRERAHRERVQPWVAPRQARRSRGETHPVDDFLFDYYPYSVARLTTWHPGHGTEVTGRVDRFLQHPAYRRTPDGATVDADRAAGRGSRLDLAIRLLESTARREPEFGCFGMHEWAMVYGLPQPEIRHASQPLRLAPDEIVDIVDSVGLRCTHIDAYRFFTPAAAERNAHRPTRTTQPDLEQPGCVHATMDLYKYAQWFHPAVSSELTADCFELARQAREIDMRATPYDLTDLGYEPIRVETMEGRREYAHAQRDLLERATVLRGRLTLALEDVRREILQPMIGPGSSQP